MDGWMDRLDDHNSLCSNLINFGRAQTHNRTMKQLKWKHTTPKEETTEEAIVFQILAIYVCVSKLLQ